MLSSVTCMLTNTAQVSIITMHPRVMLSAEGAPDVSTTHTAFSPHGKRVHTLVDKINLTER